MLAHKRCLGYWLMGLGTLQLLSGVGVAIAEQAGEKASLQNREGSQQQMLDPRLQEAERLNKEVNRLYGTGQYAQAIPLARKALELIENARGPDHPGVARSLNSLAFCFKPGGLRCGTASVRAGVEDQRESPWPRPSRCSHKPQQLGFAASSPGRLTPQPPLGPGGYTRALYERALKIREKALGPDHPDVATSLNNLALLVKAVTVWKTTPQHGLCTSGR